MRILNLTNNKPYTDIQIFTSVKMDGSTNWYTQSIHKYIQVIKKSQNKFTANIKWITVSIFLLLFSQFIRLSFWCLGFTVWRLIISNVINDLFYIMENVLNANPWPPGIYNLSVFIHHVLPKIPVWRFAKWRWKMEKTCYCWPCLPS